MALRFVSLFVLSLTAALGAHAVTMNLDRVSQDVTTYPYHKDFKTCPISIDIAYLIDGSDSVSNANFELEKTVVKVMAYFFGVMKLGTHNGVVVFGDTATVAIKFTDHEKFEPFRDAVKALTKPGGGTRIDRALEAAHDNLFMGGGGARASPKIPKIAVLFTDGVSGGQQLDTAVQQLRAKGIIVFVVGIGSNLDVNQLRLLTPRNDFVYTATDYLDLYIKAGFIARQICQHAQNRGDMGPPGPQGPDGPPGPVGDPGPSGVPGVRGNRGANGPKGTKGGKGPDGSAGSPGAAGADGNPGPQGPKGPKGQRGGPGDVGPRGQTGDPGDDGDPGPRGPKGFPGAGGIKGDGGESGSSGSPGSSGVDGAKGQPGPSGDRGDEGAPGADASNGNPGAKGQPGAPGSPGPTGRAGAPGPKGDPGPRGQKGERGPSGDVGAPGQNGAPGDSGDAGDDGSRGPRGPTGPQGSKGLPGPGGSDGSPGNPGPRGLLGPDGSNGNNANQQITCIYRQSASGQASMSCNDLSYTATDCGCSRGCGGWRISQNGQTCTCECNTYVPNSFREVGVQCCRLA